MEETGQGITEYALILALVFMAALVGLGVLGTTLRNSFDAARELFDTIG